jgi:hypothetical protein
MSNTVAAVTEFITSSLLSTGQQKQSTEIAMTESHIFGAEGEEEALAGQHASGHSDLLFAFSLAMFIGAFASGYTPLVLSVSPYKYVGHFHRITMPSRASYLSNSNSC